MCSCFPAAFFSSNGDKMVYMYLLFSCSGIHTLSSRSVSFISSYYIYNSFFQHNLWLNIVILHVCLVTPIKEGGILWPPKHTGCLYPIDLRIHLKHLVLFFFQFGTFFLYSQFKVFNAVGVLASLFVLMILFSGTERNKKSKLLDN